MKNYKYIIFDLFDTLILFKPELLPEVKINGKVHNSTGLEVYDTFENIYGTYDSEMFFKYFFESYKDFQNLKNLENREYPNQKRFEIMLDMMGLEYETPEVLEELVLSHMNSLSKSMVFPENNLKVISELLDRGYKLSILSNFDYSPTAYKLLELYEITTYIKRIYISDQIGWRKPSPLAFKFVLDSLGISPNEAVFIGDDYERDIIGANISKIDSIFIDSESKKDNYMPAIASVSDFNQILDILN